MTDALQPLLISAWHVQFVPLPCRLTETVMEVPGAAVVHFNHLNPISDIPTESGKPVSQDIFPPILCR